MGLGLGLELTLTLTLTPMPLTVRVRYWKKRWTVVVQPIDMGHVPQPHRVTSTIVI